MCSIFGIVEKNGPLPPARMHEAQGLIQALHHRGPDAGRVRACDARVLLGSNRLRITDNANPGADMPIVSADGQSTIVFNGEIYNYRDLKAQLAGYPWRTESDTEVILAAYQKWGRDCVRHLEGMYAFAIHDARTGNVFMASDPTGQKSIYVYEDLDSLVFASEMDALVADRYRDKTYNAAAIGEFVAHRYILGADTHVKEIRKILPGHWMEVAPGGVTRSGRFHTLPVGNQARADVPGVLKDIRGAVDLGCERTFNLEVPYGLLLSGGIDSTAVLAAGYVKGLKFKTFSVGFNAVAGSASIFNEFEHSRALAKAYGSDHEEIVLEAADYCSYLDKWADISGEPLGSQEAPCLIRLFESAAGQVKVVFSGSGPDELFDGYSYGKRMAAHTMEELPEAYYKAFQWTGGADVARLIPGTDVAGNVAQKYRDILKPYQGVITDTLQAVQALHFHGRLAAYEFRQMDVISMQHSIEARSPLIDGAVIRAAFNFDPALKQLNGDEKGIYKQAMRGLVPDGIIDRKKAGFPIPSEMWFSKDFEDRAGILFDRNAVLTGAGGLDPAYLRGLWASPDPATRNIFSRLYTAERLLQRQAPLMAKTL